MRPRKIPILIILFYLKLISFGYAQEFSSNSAEDFISKLLWKINEVEHDNDEILKRYYLGLEGLENKVSDSIKFKFHSYFTEIMSQKLIFHESIKNAKQAVLYAKRIGNFDAVSRHYSNIALNYIKIDYPDSARAIYHENIKLIKNTPKSVYSLSSINNLGILLFENYKENDSAMYYFNKLYEYPKKIRQEQLLEWSIKDNMALVHMSKKEYVRAKELFHENYKVYGANYKIGQKTTERWIRAGLQLAEVEILLNNFKDAKKLLLEIQGHLEMLGNYGKSRTQSDLLNYKINRKYELAIGNYKMVNDLMVRISHLSDSINSVLFKTELSNRSDIMKFELIHAKELFNNEKRISYEEENRSFILKMLLVIIVGSIILASFLIFQRNKERIKAIAIEKTLIEEKINSTMLEKQLLKQDLFNLSINITEKQNWNKRIYFTIFEILESKDISMIRDKLKKLGREIKSKTVTEHLTEDIPKRIETLNSEFYFNLKNRFPNLTKTDVRLCSLIRLNVENSDIAILQNVSKKSVYTSRFRLRKRLGLDENINLDDFVKNI